MQSFLFATGIEGSYPVVAGRNDRVLPPSFLVRACAPPHTNWLEWDHCGHVPVWDRPDDCATVVRARLRSA